MPAGTIGGLKLANRQDINKALTYQEASDVERFRMLLQCAFGSADKDSDADFSYILHDNDTMVIVRAYSAQSGPAYGGEPDDCFVDWVNNDFRLKPEVKRTLIDLDLWLERKSE